MDKINAVELRREHEGKYVRFETLAAHDYTAMKFNVEFGAPITVTGRLVGVENGMTMMRGWSKITVEVNGGWSTPDGFVTQFTLGGNRHVEFTSAPDADSEHKCIVRGCEHGATHVALDIDGETRVTVCKRHSYMSRWWGVWPVENDDKLGVPVGGTGDVSEAERQFREGLITRAYLGRMVDEVASKSSGAVSLGKALKVQPRPLRRKSATAIMVEPVLVSDPTSLELVSDIEVNWDIKFDYATRIVEGTVYEIIPSSDPYIELVKIMPASGILEEYYLHRDGIVERHA